MIEKLIKLAERDGIVQTHEPMFGATRFIFKISEIKVELITKFKDGEFLLNKNQAYVSFKSRDEYITINLENFNTLKRIAHEQLVAKQLKESQEFRELLDSV